MKAPPNNHKHIPPPFDSKRGSVLILVLIFAMAISIVVATLLSSGVVEKKVNHSHFNRIKAQNAAEVIVDYGFAELTRRWQNSSSFSFTELQPQENPLELPDAFYDLFENTEVIPESAEIVGGVVSPGTWRYIDPNDPANLNDNNRGKIVYAREVAVYGKVTASKPPFTKPHTAYAMQYLQVRDAPLFSHAIFYNMQVEFHPGPEMDIWGPVHSNGDSYLQAVNKIRFHRGITAAGDALQCWFTGSRTQSGQVLINNGEDWIQLTPDNDSSMGDDFRAYATNTWKGNLLTEDHEVPTLNPIGIENYTPDDPFTSQSELFNGAYAIIEPQLPSNHPDFKGAEIQAEQFSYKANLIIRIRENQSAPQGYEFELLKYNRSDPSNPMSTPLMKDGFPEEIALPTASLPADTITIEAYAEDDTGMVTGGLYDRRQLTGYDLVNISIDKLRSAIDPEHPNYDSGILEEKFDPNKDWNGIIYIESPLAAQTSGGRLDKVIPAIKHLGVRLLDGGEPINPPGAINEGMTIATNAPMFVQGHFNADGNRSTGSERRVDNNDEPPVALAADAITILSGAFNNLDTKLPRSKRKADHTEFSGALLTGITPSNLATGVGSGGAHNFPRLLEDWGSRDLLYRGSMVGLFESEVATNGMGNDHSQWYSPPRRKWGFNNLFADGRYPPGTPNSRDFRRINFRYLSQEEYNEGLREIDQKVSEFQASR